MQRLIGHLSGLVNMGMAVNQAFKTLLQYWIYQELAVNILQLLKLFPKIFNDIGKGSQHIVKLKKQDISLYVSYEPKLFNCTHIKKIG